MMATVTPAPSAAPKAQARSTLENGATRARSARWAAANASAHAGSTAAVFVAVAAAVAVDESVIAGRARRASGGHDHCGRRAPRG